MLLLLGCQIEQGITDGKSTDDTAEDDPYDPLTDDSDLDGTVDAADCAPRDVAIHPGAVEHCDAVDNDCDGDVDEGFDLDDDGWMDALACYMLPGDWDCDDGDDRVFPGADEVCDGVDNDCNGQVDDLDEDQDGTLACDDCDDGDPFTFPGAAEACDAVDNNCDGRVDEGWDTDGDGWSRCEGDCDDDDPAYSPGAGDACDGVDNNCNGSVDEGYDVDADGITVCQGDCDDTRAEVFPGNPEACDGLDNDCDAATVETRDGDGDGLATCDGDCDDDAAEAFPGGVEACDGLDNDCSGHVDDEASCWSCSDIGSYLLCTTPASWTEAEDVCEGLATSLAIANDSAENSYFAELSSTPTWIGATDAATEGTWLTPLGDPVSYDRWAAGEPDGINEDCALFNPDGRRTYWADATCSASYRFLCEVW